jgi:uncharacterized protein YbjT (DUF2867 family)
MMNTKNGMEQRPLLVTGATGYVGGRLLHALEAGGHRVRCLARHPEFLRSRVAHATEVVQGDVLDPASLARVLSGVHTAYYLVHSMGSTGGFEEEDRRAAQNFAAAARAAGVQRIIYLGGLGDREEGLSPHLRSRHEVGDLLRESGVQVIEFRASIVIGSGSLSFEMVRALVERLPIMITPRWVATLAQPIGIEDLVDYLSETLVLSFSGNPIFEIGGADRVSYGEVMREYARQRGLKRLMIRVPILSPRLSSLWLGLVTPVYARVGRKIVDSVCHATVVKDPAALSVFSVRPIGVRDAIHRALHNEDQEFARTRWSDALSVSGGARSWGGVRFGSRLIDSRCTRVPVPPSEAFAPIRRIGGTTGWYYGGWLWRLRGFIDLVLGGIGVRRGRRDPEWLRVGDTVDWWRVETIEPNQRLRLVAEMKLPGRAWLEFEVMGDSDSSQIRQTAIFDPIGVGGLAYWYLVYPLHQVVFAGMLRGIAAASLRPGPEGEQRRG